MNPQGEYINMSKINTAFHLLKTPGKLILPLAELGAFNWMSDETYLKFVYKGMFDRNLNLNSPQLFTEKIQWLKLHDRQERYIELVDKIAVKEYVKKVCGDSIVVPTIGVWDSFEDIHFEDLPDKFVLKCNHDSGSVIICRDKNRFDVSAAKKKIERRLKKDSFYWGREWPYKFVKRMIMAEEFLEEKGSASKDITDYKIFCFNGEPIYCQVISDRSTSEKIDFFDMDWKHQPFVGLTPGVNNTDDYIQRPYNLEKMKFYSTLLSKDTFFCRVDFYEVNCKLYFGEITFYPKAGFGEFTPSEWDLKLGQMIHLPI